MQLYSRPIVISVAGFDPSGGAGLLADVKTLEQQACLGMGVVSALTIQTEDQFFSVQWMGVEEIMNQLQPLLNRYNCSVIKVGIIKNIDTLQELVDRIHQLNPKIKIVWDTVLASSTGFGFIQDLNQEKLKKLLAKLFLITPNIHEAKTLAGLSNETEAARYLSEYCAVLLKGGHCQQQKGTDILFEQNEEIIISGSTAECFSKHGSGCILSSAIAANLAKEYSLSEACRIAKIYIEKTLNSNPQLLAYHAQ